MSKIVSIIVPCFKQAQYLDEALQSVENQTYVNWECIIVNDGSPDDTESVVKKWLLRDIRFKYLYKNNGGLPSARNFGISHAEGEYILPLDADDKISKNYISLALNAFQENKKLRVVYCKSEKFGEESGVWELPIFSLFNLSRKNLIFPSAMFKKRDCESVGGYDENMIYGWEDWELWISLLKNGGDVKQLDIVGFYYRVKKVSMLTLIDSEKSNYLSEYLSVKHADFFVKHYGSFGAMNNALIDVKKNNEINLKSEKFVIDVFFKRFFGFTVFGKYK